LLPLATRERGATRQPGRGAMVTLAVIFALLLVRSLLSAVLFAGVEDSALPPAERAAMRWVTRHTPPHSAFIVFSDEPNGGDDDAEWFPALTGRISLETEQGQEWVPGAFARRTRQVLQIVACNNRLSCFNGVLRRDAIHPGYIFFARRTSDTLCAGLCVAMQESRQYVRVYGGQGAWIYHVRVHL
jgi:hypothetical protein